MNHYINGQLVNLDGWEVKDGFVYKLIDFGHHYESSLAELKWDFETLEFVGMAFEGFGWIDKELIPPSIHSVFNDELALVVAWHNMKKESEV